MDNAAVSSERLESTAMTPTARYALNWMGGTVAAIAVMFVALRFWDYSEQTDFRSLSLSTWGWIAVCSIIYCLANLFLTQGWRLLLMQFGRSEEHTSELQSLMRSSYAVFC